MTPDAPYLSDPDVRAARQRAFNHYADAVVARERPSTTSGEDEMSRLLNAYGAACVAWGRREGGQREVTEEPVEIGHVTAAGHCVECERCGFRYGNEHFEDDGKYRCPLCELDALKSSTRNGLLTDVSRLPSDDANNPHGAHVVRREFGSDGDLVCVKAAWYDEAMRRLVSRPPEAPGGDTERDAARYRFLRDNRLQLRAVDGNARFCGQITATQFDDYTDTAMEENAARSAPGAPEGQHG